MTDHKTPSQYKFSWNGRVELIRASTYSEARRSFNQKFGFWPDENIVDIKLLEEDQ
jgi:hypothetical protein